MIPHFKEKVLINNLFQRFKALWSKILPQDLKTFVYFFFGSPSIWSFTNLLSGINLPCFECAIVLHMSLHQLWWFQSCSRSKLRSVSNSDWRYDLCLHQAQKNTRSWGGCCEDESRRQLKINVELISIINYHVIENTQEGARHCRKPLGRS